MNYPDYYLKACQILECKPDDSIDAKKAAFHRMLEQWQQEYQYHKHDRGDRPELSEHKLEELKWAMAVIYEFQGSLEPQPKPSNWRDRFWQNLPVGQLIPEFSLADGFGSRVAPVISNGIMYADYQDLSIGAIDIVAKEEIWRFAANGRTTSPVVHRRGIVFFGSTDRYAYAVDAGSGEEIWRFRASAQIHLAPVVSDQSVYFAIGHRQIHCFDFATGRKKWHSKTESKVEQSPFLHDDSALLSDDWRRLYCFHAETGALQWTVRSTHLNPSKCVQQKAIVVTNLTSWLPLRLPYTSDSHGNAWSMAERDLTERDPVTGEETATEYDPWPPSSLLAFHVMTGRVVWVLPMPGPAQRLFSFDGIVYGICNLRHRHDIFAIDGETGQQLWTIPLEPQEKYGRFFAGDGKTYYIDQTGNVYEMIIG